MAAEFKSHVLRRDEKGFFGIPFKRLLLAGVGGGLSYTIVNLGLPGMAVPVAVVMTFAIVIMTGTRGGLPLWQRLVYRVRGVLLLTALHHPNGVFGQAARSLELPLYVTRLNGAKVFAPSTHNVEVDLREWVLFAQARDLDSDDGLVFVDSALTDEA